MYKILGDDGNEYGPVSAEQIKKWIAENRLEKKSPVFPEGAKDWIFLSALPEFAAVFNPPPPVISSAPTNSGVGLNTIIPYKNIRALLAYYFAIFSVIPFLGIPAGAAGFVLGILGLRFRAKNPAAGGKIHSWIGIILGGLFGFGWLALLLLIIFKLKMR